MLFTWNHFKGDITQMANIWRKTSGPDKASTRLLALTLAFVMIWALFITAWGSLDVATDTILSFESSAPVMNLTVDVGTGRPHLPDTLRAVVKLADIRPASPPQQDPSFGDEGLAGEAEELPEDASDQIDTPTGIVSETEALPAGPVFETMAPPAHHDYQAADGSLCTYTNQKGDVSYRVYGTYSGSAPAWFACDEYGDVYGMIKEIPVSWSCADFDQDIPGAYTFTAAFHGYSYAGPRPVAVVTVEDPSPASLLPGTPRALTYSIDISTVSGSGTGYTFRGGVLTFTSAANGNEYIISGTTTDRRIVVQNSTAVITLDGLSITSAVNGAPPFLLTGSAAPTLILAAGSSNTLRSTCNVSMDDAQNNAGLGVPEGTTVTITGSGQLTAEGGTGGAGIGGGYTAANCGTVHIVSGSITATGTAAAGIGGGGVNGIGGVINITGGSVRAAGGGNEQRGGAGIGSTSGANNGGTIKISGGATVQAQGASGSAGIGGGYSSPNRITEISGYGTTVTAAGGGGGAGIGGGSAGLGGGGTVKITNGADVTAIGDNRGAGIGAGSASTVGGAALTLDNTVTVKAFSTVSVVGGTPTSSGAQPAIHASSNSGNGYYINAVLNADNPEITRLDFKKDGGSAVGSINRPLTSSVGYYYRAFAYTNPSMEAGDYNIYAYNSAGASVGQIHTVAGTSPASAKIPAVAAGAYVLSGATQVKLDAVVVPPDNPSAGTLTVSEVTATTATFTSTGHNLDGATYHNGYFRYSQTKDEQGNPSGGMQISWQSAFPGSPYSLTATGLTPGTLYYVQTVLETGAGKVVSNVVSFTTPALAAPSPGTLTVPGVTATSAVFTNTGHSLGDFIYTNAYFRCSTTKDIYGNPTGGTMLTWPSTYPGSTCSLTAASLTPGTTYYVQTTLVTTGGTVAGDVVSFTTPAAPSAAQANPGIPYVVGFEKDGTSTYKTTLGVTGQTANETGQIKSGSGYYVSKTKNGSSLTGTIWSVGWMAMVDDTPNLPEPVKQLMYGTVNGLEANTRYYMQTGIITVKDPTLRKSPILEFGTPPAVTNTLFTPAGIGVQFVFFSAGFYQGNLNITKVSYLWSANAADVYNGTATRYTLNSGFNNTGITNAGLFLASAQPGSTTYYRLEVTNEAGQTASVYLSYTVPQATNYSVTVSNMVSGPYASTSRPFSYTITFRDANGNIITDGKTVTYTGGVIPGSDAVAPTGGNWVLDGSAKTFMLKHGQKLTIAGIPANSKVQITQEAAGGYSTSFKDSKDQAPTPGGDTDARELSDDNRVFDFKNVDSIVPTGIFTGSLQGPVLLMLAAFLLGIGFVVFKKYRGHKESF